MPVTAGTVVYSLGATPCSGLGLSWSNEDLDAALNERVAGLVFDDEGRADLESLVRELADTDFDQEGINQILFNPEAINNWRVGEAIAEAYLADHRSCQFPWPLGRDERKSGSSLPGADLVGFRTDENGVALAFGEVKTSSETNYPPRVMYGETGLKKQLENLRDQEKIRDDLVKYLGHRAKGEPWRARFIDASRRYIENSSDVHLYGVLIRDVVPHQDDFNLCVMQFGAGCPEGTRIEFLAVYLPNGRINGLGADLAAMQAGENP